MEPDKHEALWAMPNEVNDYFDFEKLAETSLGNPELSPLEQLKLQRTYFYLGETIGENNKLKVPNGFHPLVGYFSNAAKWSQQWIIWFGETLAKLEDAEGFASLIKRIKNPDKFNEALSVLEACHRYREAGFEIAIDIAITFEEKERVPDLLLINRESTERAYVEVSELQKSPEESQRNIIWEMVHLLGVRGKFCARLLKHLSNDSFTLLQKDLNNFIIRAFANHSFMEFDGWKGTLELATAPLHSMTMLEHWCNEKGYEINSFGYPQGPSALHRIQSKIRKEHRQLPINSPNIIHLKTSHFLHFLEDRRAFMDQLEESLHMRKHVLALVITEQTMNLPDRVIMGDGFKIFTQVKRGNNVLLHDHVVFILNKFCNAKISPSFLDKLAKSMSRS